MTLRQLTPGHSFLPPILPTWYDVSITARELDYLLPLDNLPLPIDNSRIRPPSACLHDQDHAVSPEGSSRPVPLFGGPPRSQTFEHV
jgi:hypothetical protein